jgi:hypothetical protein
MSNPSTDYFPKQHVADQPPECPPVRDSLTGLSNEIDASLSLLTAARASQDRIQPEVEPTAAGGLVSSSTDRAVLPSLVPNEHEDGPPPSSTGNPLAVRRTRVGSIMPFGSSLGLNVAAGARARIAPVVRSPSSHTLNVAARARITPMVCSQSSPALNVVADAHDSLEQLRAQPNGMIEGALCVADDIVGQLGF